MCSCILLCYIIHIFFLYKFHDETKYKHYNLYYEQSPFLIPQSLVRFLFLIGTYIQFLNKCERIKRKKNELF